MATKKTSFARRLRQLRETAGLSANELGRRAGLAHGFVAQLERGRKAPSLETARKLAEALGQTMACWD